MFACLDPIEFDVPAGLSDSVVIQGRVVRSDTSFIEVIVSKLFDFSPESRQPVRLSDVTLINDLNNRMTLRQISPGYYKQILDDNTLIQAQVGQGYKIIVNLEDGRTFESELDILPEGNQPEALEILQIQEEVRTAQGLTIKQDKLKIQVDTKISNNTNGGIYW